MVNNDWNGEDGSFPLLSTKAIQKSQQRSKTFTRGGSNNNNMTMSPMMRRSFQKQRSNRDRPYDEFDDSEEEEDEYSVGGYLVKRRHPDHHQGTRLHPWKKPTRGSSSVGGDDAGAYAGYSSAATKYRQLSSSSSKLHSSQRRRLVSPPTTPSRPEEESSSPKTTPAPRTTIPNPPPPPPPPATPPTPATPLHDRYAIAATASSSPTKTTNAARASIHGSTPKVHQQEEEPLTAECYWKNSDRRISPPSTPPQSRRPSSRQQQQHHPVTPPSPRNGSSYIPNRYRSSSNQNFESKHEFTDGFLKNYSKISKEPAYRHAQRAGVLWQTLVGQHVRFPKHWWSGARAPKMGLCLEQDSARLYQYIARHRIYSNATFSSLVHNRGSAGRLLLHVIIRNSRTNEAVQDVVIGCFHPNARGVRSTPEADKKEEDCRIVWMATRKRVEDEEMSFVVDPLLTRGRSISELANESPLGEKKWVSNMNMRDVFGERPPLQTVFITEIQLDEIMVQAEEQNSFAAPALVLLREYLFP